MKDKLSMMSCKSKIMYLARRIGDGPIQVYMTDQFLDHTERFWEFAGIGIATTGRCAIAATEDDARSLVMWGPRVAWEHSDEVMA